MNPGGVEPLLFEADDPVRLAARLARAGSGVAGLAWAHGRAWLLCESPPAGFPERHPVTAHREAAPSVWVPVGRKLTAPPQSPEAGWLVHTAGGPVAIPALRGGPPRHFRLAGKPGRIAAANRPRPVGVRLHLVPARQPRPATLWALRAEELRRLVDELDEGHLALLEAARSESDGRVLLRLPGKGRKPPLVLPGQGFAAARAVNHLFLPEGYELRPEPRVDVLRRLLAPDGSRVTWVEGVPGRVGSVPRAAFRPLADSVEYLPPAGRGRAIHWVPSDPFALPRLPRPAGRPAPHSHSEDDPVESARGFWSGMASRVKKAFRTSAKPDQPGAAAPSLEAAVRVALPKPAAAPKRPIEPPDALKARLARMEQRLLELAEPTGDDWAALAGVYSALGNNSDAAASWLNAVWLSPSPDRLWCWGWLRAEVRSVRGSMLADDIAARIEAGQPAPPDFWLNAAPTPGHARTLAAYVTWATAGELPTGFAGHVAALQHYLDAQESWLPVRAAWLSRLGLARSAGGDALALARAADRLRSRLRDHGLSRELDAPSFLRFAKRGISNRYQQVCDWLGRLRGTARDWAKRVTAASATPSHQALIGAGMTPESVATPAYIDLILAWGLARLGEHQTGGQWVEAARPILRDGGPVHAALFEAFAYRIGQVREGRAPRDALPAALLRAAGQFPDPDHYCFHALRESSHILEPAIGVRAWREAVAWGESAVGLADRAALSGRVRRALQALRGDDRPADADVLDGILDVAGLLEESVAAVALKLAEVLLGEDGLGQEQRVGLLGRSLRLCVDADSAAGFARLAARAPDTLRRAGDDAEFADQALVIDQAVRGARRFGRRDESERLFAALRSWADPGRPALRARLAAGWFDLGDEPTAMAILEDAREALLRAEMPARDRVRLAKGYLLGLGRAGVKFAMIRVEELLRGLSLDAPEATTNARYTLCVLDVVETAVRVVVDEDFAPGPQVADRLERDEVQVRKKVEGDLSAALGKG